MALDEFTETYPRRVFIILIVWVFVIEWVVMLLPLEVFHLSKIQLALMDASLLSLLLSVPVYFVLYKPLLAQLARQRHMVLMREQALEQIVFDNESVGDN